ncbi:hypothetical protein ACER1F_001866 [Vibrio alginolyticus]|uniref:hypothetical protein n=1 Tax=Vibrio TaxID=662 RepID=UPI0015F3D7D0|nr:MULTISPECIES: hypothetical protein [Vibrio]USD73155.1 hypothetical protein J4N43_10040 [Vibrio sp. SCSIO 43009]
MLLVLRIGLTLYCFLTVGSVSEWLAISLSGVLTALISLFIIVPSFKLSFWRTLQQLTCSRLVLTGISAFVIATFVYGQLTLLVELNQPLLKGLHRPDFPGYWAAARAYDTFFVWVGLFLVLTILLEEWRVLFSRPPTFNWYYLQGVSVTLAFAVVACDEYLGSATQAWLSAVVSYVVIVLFHIGGFTFDQKQPKRNTRWLV